MGRGWGEGRARVMHLGLFICLFVCLSLRVTKKSITPIDFYTRSIVPVARYSSKMILIRMILEEDLPT